MKSTIGKRILMVILVPFLIIFGTLAIYIAYTVFQYVNDWTELEIKGITEINAANLEGRIYSVMVSVQSTAAVLETLDAEAEGGRIQAENMIKSMFKNEHVYNSWLAFEPEAFDGRDREHAFDYPGSPSGRFIRSYIMEDGQIAVAPDMDERTLDDPSLSPWYVAPRDIDSLYIDIDNEIPNIYDYGLGHEPVYTLSVVAPVHRDGRVIGCVGADVLFSDMTFGIGESEKAAVAVFYPNGRIFFSQDLAFAEESVDTLGFSNTSRIKDAISKGESLFLPDEYSIFLDTGAFTYFQPISVSGTDGGSLFLYVAKPRSEAFNAFRPVFVLTAAIMIAVFAAMIVIFLYVTYSISKPVRKLTLAADAISQGNLETEISSFSNAKDEIGLMSRSLHRMVEQFRIYIIRLEQAQEQMAAHSQIGSFIEEADDICLAFGEISAMLCRHMGFYKATAVYLDAGRASVLATFETDAGLRESNFPAPPDFLYHSQAQQLLAGRKLLFLNSFAILEHKVQFTGPETLSVCVMPIWIDDSLSGYFILENRDKGKSVGAGEESLLIYIAGILSGWLSQKNEPGEDTDEAGQGSEPAGNPPAAADADAETERASYPGGLSELREIGGLNIDSALETMGGLADIYESSIRLFARLAPETVKKLDRYIENDLSAFTIEIHGLKGSLHNIGAIEQASLALRIESAARSGDAAFCKENYPGFRATLREFCRSHRLALMEDNSAGKPPGDAESLAEALGRAREAAEGFDSLEAFEIIAALGEFSYGDRTDALLAEAAHSLEVFDCEKALAAINDLITVNQLENR